MNISNQRKNHTTFVKLVLVGVLALSAFTNLAEARGCGNRPGCINSKDVKNDNLTAIDLKDEAGAKFESGELIRPLSGGTDVVKSITIIAPTAGQVIVNASGTFFFENTTVTGIEFANCSITTNAAPEDTHLIEAREAFRDTILKIPFAATRGFVVPAGSTTFNFACTGTANTVKVLDPSMTAIFVPTAY